MKKILVTGGAGYIGAHTAHLLLRRGYDVTVVDNLSRGYRHNVDARRLHVISLSDTDALRKLLGEGSFAAVVHFAAYMAVGESTEKPEMYFANNVGGTLSLTTAMLEAGVQQLVFSSTAAVYGTPEHIPIGEDVPLVPVNPYGESKLITERILRWLDQCRGLRTVVLRYFNACGANAEEGLGEEHDPETHLIPLLLRAVITGRPITVFGEDYDTPDGTCVRDYIHVSDLAEAHVLALEALGDGAPSGAFNVGTGTGYSVREVIQTVEEVTGKRVPHVVGPRREGDPPTLVADAQKLRETMGWRPRFSDLREIVASAWRFECARKA